MEDYESLQSQRKSERPSTNPIKEVATASNENKSTVGCTDQSRLNLDQKNKSEFAKKVGTVDHEVRP